MKLLQPVRGTLFENRHCTVTQGGFWVIIDFGPETPHLRGRQAADPVLRGELLPSATSEPASASATDLGSESKFRSTVGNVVFSSIAETKNFAQFKVSEAYIQH